MSVFDSVSLTNKSGGSILASDALKGKVVGLYFSAHWCPPCRTFTPLLAEFYEDVSQQGVQFEIVFVSSDKSKEAMEEYMRNSHGDWLAIPFGSEVIAKLKTKYSISSIPTLIIINDQGIVLTKEGRREVAGQGPNVAKKWLDKLNALAQ